LWRSQWRHTEQPSFDTSNIAAVVASFETARTRTASVTMYMCWHGGIGHDYPNEVMQAASRLRERHGAASGSDDDYTMLTLTPSETDWRDLLVVVPYCDWAYATDAAGDVLAEGGSA
jgi:hypothetical protein